MGFAAGHVSYVYDDDEIIEVISDAGYEDGGSGMASQSEDGTLLLSHISPSPALATISSTTAALTRLCVLCGAPVSAIETAVQCLSPGCTAHGHVVCWGDWTVSMQREQEAENMENPKDGDDNPILNAAQGSRQLRQLRIVPKRGLLACPSGVCVAKFEWIDLVAAVKKNVAHVARLLT